MNIEKAQIALLLAQTAEVLGRLPGDSQVKALQQLNSLLGSGLPEGTPTEACESPECKEDVNLTVEELRQKYTPLDLIDIIMSKSREKGTTLGELMRYGQAAGRNVGVVVS